MQHSTQPKFNSALGRALISIRGEECNEPQRAQQLFAVSRDIPTRTTQQIPYLAIAQDDLNNIATTIASQKTYFQEIPNRQPIGIKLDPRATSSPPLVTGCSTLYPKVSGHFIKTVTLVAVQKKKQRAFN